MNVASGLEDVHVNFSFLHHGKCTLNHVVICKSNCIAFLAAEMSAPHDMT